MRKYSFIIPVYQGKRTIENTLSALDNLKVDKSFDFEVIVADDGSTDGTFEMLKNRKQSYTLKSVYIPRDALSCRSRARNRAIKKADGDILVFIDSDILVRPEYLLDLQRFYSYDDNIAVSGFRTLLHAPVENEVIKSGKIFDEDYLSKIETGTDFRHVILSDISYNAAAMDVPFLYALSCNLAIPRRWVEEVGGYDEDLIKWGIEDIEFVYRLYCRGMRIVFNSRSEVLHQYHYQADGVYINEDQINDVNYNTAVFLKKHPHFCGLSDDMCYKLFHSIATEYVYLENSKRKNSIVLDFERKEDYDEILEKINEYKNISDTNIIIYDSVQNTDLDIVLQLMPKTKAAIRYFPEKYVNDEKEETAKEG